MADIAGESTAAPDPTADALRRAIEGQFRLDREIGRGGMGVVYLAHDEQLHRSVAIKTLPPHLSADAQIRSRFLREARTAAGLSHANIVPIFSAAERDTVVYFTMGYVDGESLAERVARSGPLTPTELVRLLDELAAALGFAHARGVVHRDVKAENVLLDRQTGRAMVTDFGIARVTEAQPLTATGTVLGTVHYMSPEQVTGDPLDGRSDLYSLGVLAFFALTGRFPFERASASAVVVAHVNSPPPNLRDIWPACPAILNDIVGRLLEKQPAARYENADALRDALRAAERESRGHAVVRDVPIPGTNRSEPMMLSSRDAQEVWSRAAELQAHTGMITPPAQFASRPAETPLTQGYDMSVVRASAEDAGIDAKYVERAMLERAAAAPLTIERGEIMNKKPNFFMGAPTKLEFNSAFDGELDDDAFEEVADEIRSALGEMVTVSAVGRTLTVNTGVGTRQGGVPRSVQVHLASRYGRTTVRVFEDLSQTAGGLFAGLGVGAGVGASALASGLVGKFTHSPALVIATLVGTMSLALFASRTLFMSSARKKTVELELLLQRVVARARRSLLERPGQQGRLKG